MIRRCRTSYLRKEEKADGVDRNLKTVGAWRGWEGWRGGIRRLPELALRHGEDK